MRIKKNEGGKTVYFVYNGNDPILEYSATEAKYTYCIYAGKQSIAEETNGVSYSKVYRQDGPAIGYLIFLRRFFDERKKVYK
jgi:hypothetical protein